MAAIAAMAYTEKRTRGADAAAKSNNVYTRVVTFVIPASVTAGTADITGLTLPPGSLLLGGSLKPSQDFGDTATLAFKTKTAGVTFSAAATRRAEASLIVAAGQELAVPTSATAEDTIQVVLAAAAAPASDTTFELTLVIAPAGAQPVKYTTKST